MSVTPEPGAAEVSRSLILQEALTIIDRDGVDGLSMRRLSHAVGRDPAVLYRHVLRLGLHRLPITEFPQVRALAEELASYDGSAELDRGLNLLLPGLQSALSHRTRKGDTK